MIECFICGKSLAGGIDTFGEQGSEMCQRCWLNAAVWFDAKPEVISKSRLADWNAGRPIETEDDPIFDRPYLKEKEKAG